MWDGKRYEIETLPLHVDTTLSRVILRPDFEEEYKDDFVKALELYHNGQYSTALDIINQYFTKERQGPAATVSFKLLHQLVSQDKPNTWVDVSPINPPETLHMEDLIRNLVACAQEWMFRITFGGSLDDNKSRMDVLENFLSSALSQIQEWIPMPPVKGADLTDMKIYGRIMYHQTLSFPKGRLIKEWSDFSLSEEKEFQIMCRYLLKQRRIDLLIHAVDFRTWKSNNSLDKLGIRSILIEASKSSMSNYQALKCQVRCGLRKVLIKLKFEPEHPDIFKAHTIYSMPSTESSSMNLRRLLSIKGQESKAYKARPLIIDATMSLVNGIFDISNAKGLLWKQGSLLLVNDWLFQSFPYCSMALRYQLANEQAIQPKLVFYCILQVGAGRNLDCPGCLRIVNALRKLELTTSDFQISLELREEKKAFLCLMMSSLKQSLCDTTLSYSNGKLLSTCLYLENVLQELKRPVNGDWLLFDLMLRVYEFWFLPVLNLLELGEHASQLALLPIAEKLVYIASLRLRWARSEREARRSACRFIFHLVQYSLYVLPEQVPKVLSIAQKVAGKYFALALESGFSYDAFEISVFGLLSSVTQPSQSMESNEFWQHLQICLKLHKKKLNIRDTDNELPDLGPVFLSFKDSSDFTIGSEFSHVIRGLILSSKTCVECAEKKGKQVQGSWSSSICLCQHIPKLDGERLLALGKITIHQTIAPRIVDNIASVEGMISKVREYKSELTHDYLMARYENPDFLKPSKFPNGNDNYNRFFDSRAMDEMFVKVESGIINDI